MSTAILPEKGNIPAKTAQNRGDFSREAEKMLNFHKRFYSIFAEFVKGRQILIEKADGRRYNIIARAGNDSSPEKNANTI